MTMANDPCKALLIADDLSYARILQERLSQEATPAFLVQCTDRLQSGLEWFAKEGADVVLLDLHLPDSQGLETLIKAHAQAPEVPIVVLSGVDDDTVALEAVRRGAQDFLVKGQVDAVRLRRILRYAMERHRMQESLRGLALIDELTGLYNRRGFLNLAAHHMKLARRTQRGSVLACADLDGLKQINDTFGHREGDQALIGTAGILRKMFRTSDILARIGGDEFTILAIQASEDSTGVLMTRLDDHLTRHNAQASCRYPLSFSLGMVYIDHDSSLSIEECMIKADAALYEQKRGRKAHA